MHHPDTRTPPDTEPTADRGWAGLVCPRCLEQAPITVGLDDLCRFSCGCCGDAFSLADLEAIIGAWAPVLSWLRAAPVKE